MHACFFTVTKVGKSSQGDITEIGGTMERSKDSRVILRSSHTAEMQEASILQGSEEYTPCRDMGNKHTAEHTHTQGIKERRHYRARSKTLREPEFIWGHSETFC